MSYMTNKAPDQSDFERRLQELTQQQNAALAMVVPHLGTGFASAKLCGGTALSRFYLQHRLSYDLDFFLPSGFNAQAMLDQLASKVAISNLEITHDSAKADQLHFTVETAGSPIKISLVEDMYASLYPAVPIAPAVSKLPLMTEGIAGLYHRKLRTIVGWADAMATHPAGGRQTARDMFDLYVLSQAHMPLRPFIESLPYTFAITAFEEGLAAMPWFDLISELEETMAAPRWRAGTDVQQLRDHLYAEIGMTESPSHDADTSNR